MEVDRRFLLLCAGEVLVVAAGNLLLLTLFLQALVLGAFLEDWRGYPIFVFGVSLIGVVLAVSGTVFLPLLALAAALGCGYVVLTLRDYRLVRWAGDET